MSTVKTLRFRVLVMDEDPELLEILAAKLEGYTVTVGNRVAVAEVARLLVTMESDGTPKGRVSSATVTSFDLVSTKKFDMIVVDYAYAPKEVQDEKWNEDSGPPQKEASNARLTRLSEVRSQLLSRSSNRGAADSFFGSTAAVALRSFQHDRQFETLGPYSDRLQATKATFPKARAYYPLNGFELIFGGDRDLRDELYNGNSQGRAMYRQAMANFTRQFLESAMLRHLAARAQKLVVVRGTAAVSTLLVLIALANAITQPFITTFYEQASIGNWPEGLKSLGYGLLVILLAAVVSVVVVEFVIFRIVELIDGRAE